MRLQSLGVSLLMMCLCTTALAQAGRFQFVQGEVSVVRVDGRQFSARKGDGVEEGDTIATGPAAQAQLLMQDEGVIALRPDSRLRIETYRYAGQTDGSEKGVLGLLKGGFRAITGFIGRVNKDSYQVRTPTATIGIRGTDHEPLYIPPPAPGETPLGPPGSYDKVNVGQTYMETPNGRVELGANQVGFVPATGNVAPVRLPAIPGFMGATPPIREAARGAAAPSSGTASGSSAATTTASSDSTASGSGSTTGTGGTSSSTTLSTSVSSVLTAPVTTVLPPTSPGTFNPLNPSVGSTALPAGSAIAGGGMGLNGPNNGAGYIGDPNDPLTVMVDSSGMPVSVSGGSFSYVRNGAPAAMSGGVSIGGESVKWGVYTGGTMVDSGVTSTGMPFFWMVSTSATTAANLAAAMPSTGATLSFNTMAGHTPPITEGGVLGGTVSASVTLANLSGVPSVSAFSLNVTDAQSRTWTASLTTPQSLLTFQNGGVQNLSGSCSGCAQTAVTGNVQGVAIGNPTPVGVMSSYSMTAGSSAVAGAVVNQITR